MAKEVQVKKHKGTYQASFNSCLPIANEFQIASVPEGEAVKVKKVKKVEKVTTEAVAEPVKKRKGTGDLP